MSRKNAAAVALGRRGGSANTPAQTAARAQHLNRKGRPRERPRCDRCEAQQRTCYHLSPRHP